MTPSRSAGSGANKANTWYDARAGRVTANALRPVARPPATVTIAAHIQAMIDAANNAEGIDLGVLDPGNGATDTPYEPMADTGDSGVNDPLACVPAGRAPPHGSSDGPSCLVFYSVQSLEDADRLIYDGGMPWPTDDTGEHASLRAAHGPGLYAWSSLEDAVMYQRGLMRHPEVPRDLVIVEHKIMLEDFKGLNHSDWDAMIASGDPRTEIYGYDWSEWDHVMRATSNYGVEHYFNPAVYWVFTNSRH